MNKGLDKKLQMYIANMALSYMPFGSVWNSSAKNLEDVLRARGVKLSQKLYYKYKLPDGLKPNDFMYKLIMAEFFINFYSRYAGKILIDKNLSVSDKKKIFDYVWNNRKSYIAQSKKYEFEIKNLNPELSGIKTGSSDDIVYGATFGFAPKEIEYFADSKKRDFNYETKTCELFDKKYGIKLTYILAPDTVKKIIAALQQKALYEAKER